MKLRRPYLIARGDHRKTITPLKVLGLKCAHVTDIVKKTVMAFPARHRYQY